MTVLRRPRMTTLLVSLAAFAVVALVWLLLDSYWVGVFSQALLMGLAALALDVLVGWCGMASLGHAAYFGTAGYVLAVLTTRWGIDPWLSALAGVAVATGLALLFGPLAVRTRGLAFLTVTLAFGQVVWGLATKWRDVTGGSDGIPGVPRPSSFFGLALTDPKVFFLFTVVVIAVAVFITVRVMRGPFGLQLRGVRLSELRLRSLGYDATRLRVAAFVISAALASVAGIMFTFFNQFVGTNAVDWRLSAQMLLAVVVGGPGTLWGPFVAGFGLFFVQIFATNLTDRWTFILGLLYVLAVLFLPRGIASLLVRRKKTTPGLGVEAVLESGDSISAAIEGGK